MKEKQRTLLIKLLLGIVALAVFFFIWDLVAARDPRGLLPRPVSIFSTLIRVVITNERDPTGHVFSEHVVASLFRVSYGFFLAAVVAIPVGLLWGYSLYAEGISRPLVELFRPIPPFAWIPFAIIFFRDPFDAVFIVYLASFFPIVLSTVAGVKAVDSVLIDAARTLGANKRQLFGKVIVPASLPHIMTGLRIGLGIGWMAIVAPELVGVREGGLGFYIHVMSDDFGLYENVFAGMFLVGIIGFLMITAISYVERRLSRWAGIL